MFMFQRAISVTPVRSSTAYIARASSLPTARQLHASPIASKTPTEKVAEVAGKVNKSVGRGLASAIETGEQVTEKTKQTIGATKDRAAGDAKSTAAKLKGTAHELTEKASGLASEAKKKTNE
ncbi:hypothetical protein BJV78DRAFT_1227658 [Lactifluus subvellereus]|nr:hypothetical protein BJV78DRAFT_1227658 [Lactifluus subvellereus]